MKHLQTLFAGIGVNFEAAKIHELYAKNLYFLFIYKNDYYKHLDDRDWRNKHANKSIEIYQYLEKNWKILDILEFLANVEFLKGDYNEVIDIIDESIKEAKIDRSTDFKSMYINLLLLRTNALAAKGEFDLAMNHLEQVIQYSKSNLIMHKFYELNNMKALLLYNDFQTEKAQEATKTSDVFVNLTENVSLILEMKLTKIHYAEFFESNMEKTKELLDDVKKMLRICLKMNRIQFN